MIRAFSLIELLVVVGVIGILAALLSSASSRIKESALSASCASNLRQIGVAAASYSADHAGQVLPLYTDGNSPSTLWPCLVSAYMGNDSDTRWPPKSRVFICPKAPLRFGYGHNYYYLGWNAPTGGGPNPGELTPNLRMGGVARPSRVVFMADSINLQAADPKTTWAEALRPPFVASPDETIDFRHSGSSGNVLWLDGHVTSEIQTNIIIDKLWNPQSNGF